MDHRRSQARPSQPRIDRRSLLLASAGLASGASLFRSTGTGAQSLTGELTVQFEERGGALETEVANAIAAVTGANSGTSINVADPSAGNYIGELTLGLMTGQAADVFLVNSIALGQLAAAGLVSPISAQVQSWPDWANYPDRVKTSLQFGGETWGLPVAIDTHFLYYRKDLFSRAGIPVPWQPATLDELVNTARTLKSALPDVIPLVLFAGANPEGATAARGFLPLLRAFGGGVQDADGKWVIESCAIRDTLAFYELVYGEELVPQSVMTSVGAENAMRSAFAAGEAAIMFDGSWVWDGWSAEIPDIEETIGYARHPAANGSAPFTMGGLAPVWFINARAKAPDLAWAFLAAVNGRDSLVRINAADPHIPPRSDSMADPAFAASPFLTAMIESFEAFELLPPNPRYQELSVIVQNATGIVASGEESAQESSVRYRDELERVLGTENVVKQPCP
jgi:multiple sugar transport system substrate-binding protein